MQSKKSILLRGGLGDNIMQMPLMISFSNQLEKFSGGFDIYLDIWKMHNRDKDPEGVFKVALKQAELFKRQKYVGEVFVQPHFEFSELPSDIIDSDWQRQVKYVSMEANHLAMRNYALGRCLEYWDLSKPWIDVEPIKTDKIIICVSPRYRNPFITLRCLQGSESDFLFVGTDRDYETFYYRYGLNVERFITDSHLELAGIIKGSRFFIGGQGYNACLAEALKVPRIIIQCPRVPDVIPLGGVCNAIVNEEDLSRVFGMMLEEFSI